MTHPRTSRPARAYGIRRTGLPPVPTRHRTRRTRGTPLASEGTPRRAT